MFSNFIEILILSFVQGISEFLPVSSSAHLLIISKLKTFQSSSLEIDIVFISISPYNQFIIT